MEFDPKWNGHSFDGTLSSAIWIEFSIVLKPIVVEELFLAAELISIQKDLVNGNLLICFRGSPRSKIPETVKTHRKHRKGNYCYDKTLMSVSDQQQQNFIAFIDPDYHHEEFI